MTPLPPAPPAPRSLWPRVLVGCAIVGGLVILAGIAIFAFGVYWLTSPGKQYATGAVASPRSQGVIRVGDLAADPGAKALLAAVFQRMQEAGQREGQPQLPAWIRNLQAQQARQGIGQWLPREATISLEPDAEEVPRIVLAANMRGFVQPIRLAITQAVKGDRKSSVSRHGDREVLNFGSDTSLCFMDGTLVLSYHPSAMSPALDRLAAAGASPPPADDRGLPGKWDVTGWLDETTGKGLLAGLLGTAADSPPFEPTTLDGLRAVRFGIDLQSADDALVTTEVAFADATSAAAAKTWLAAGVASLVGRMESSGLSSSATDAVDGDRVRLELDVGGLQNALERVLQAQAESRRER